ncbi:fumarylacetoacetate hydrolase family protein [Virgibacillus chiguensis]|uniref:5-oxopent-3-ene-1,2,5-tricarboxylate decarboxylase / 2-hydroxyhepta-2,4-diene-1,7-dioate isomerase n=1 Tax=Virgibacillus chiguensis TaxID=411959 RepID=A0A1M5NZG5_9BACI|nr:fumarylacetoacetate hydrolase family protein [Virgibacillus chiguensis]SHG94921.1 5-oxopent-3-ene-1,2,5-tricarboxylate decarboxylase / 2-hydroxyhepta-2,4-diene-1,7-dioate isomerase [Virgibacillus chiguensis]
MQTIYMKLSGVGPLQEGRVDLRKQTIMIGNTTYKADQIPLEIPINGTVYGTLLNYHGAYEQLKPAMNEAPYEKPPKAPILYIKPMNTFAATASSIPCPESAVEIGAALGIVIAKTAKKVSEANALDYIKGYTIANDVSIPHDSVYRPSVKEKARDGFCPIGPWIMDKTAVDNPNNLEVRVLVNGVVKQRSNTNQLIRSVEKLLCDVTEFMTLAKGDVLLVGIPENPPRVKANERVQIEIEKVGTLENTIVTESLPAGGRI